MWDYTVAVVLWVGFIAALAAFPFFTIRGLWRLCQSIDLDLLFRGWECNVPAWQVPILFAGFVIVPLLTQGPVFSLLMRYLMLQMVGHHSVK